MSFTSLMLAAQSASSGSGTSGQMKEFISDLTNTLGVDLFDEEIDAVVFQTNQFLCDSTFIGASGPFWWILLLVSPFDDRHRRLGKQRLYPRFAGIHPQLHRFLYP